MKRYALTLTVYKFMNIGTISHVEIAICDNRGNRIILPHATWKAFIERHANIERLMQSIVSSSLSPIQNLNVEFIKVCDAKNIKLSLCGTCLYMKPTTILFLFELEQCVEYAYYKLSQCTHGVSKKFKYF